MFCCYKSLLLTKYILGLLQMLLYTVLDVFCMSLERSSPDP